MITSIQIRDNVKKQLSLLKNENQTFEDVIINLLRERELCKQKNIELIKSEAFELNNLNQKISEELQDVEDIGGEIVEW